MIRVVISSRFVRHLRVIEEEDMQIFVDADACPVVAIIEKIAKDNLTFLKSVTTSLKNSFISISSASAIL